MVYKALFLLLVLILSKATAAATEAECSTQQPGGSGVLGQSKDVPDKLQHVITTRYCFLNDCTIVNYETAVAAWPAPQ